MGALSAVVRWSLHNRPIVLLATVMFLLIGWRAAVTLPVDAVPDITTIQVQVITSAPALSPVEVEQYVTVPVERAMAGIPRSTEVRSLSKYGVSVVTVVFHDDTDIYFARQLVGERLREAEAAVPTRYGTPGMGPISTGLGEIYQFVVENDAMTLMEKKELLDWVIAPQLRTVAGVVDVNAIGGLARQYQVVLDPKRLLAAGFGVAQVVAAIEQSNTNAGGGYVEHEGEHLVVGSEGLIQKPDDLAQVALGMSAQGMPITIGSLGTVQLGPQIRRGASTKDGKGEVVVGLALMLMGENARTVTEAVKAKLALLAPSLPPGTRIEPLYDRSDLVHRTISTVGRNLLEGAALVIFILLVLLGDLRAGLVVALMIPLSLLFAVIAMNALGFSGNLMSLGAIDFGLLVDGAVIIVENVVRRLSERQALSPAPLSAEERVALVEEATLEVRAASVFGEAIIAVVYLPILFLTGTEGKLFRPMAATVLLALLGAFVLSLTLVPVLTSYVVRPARGHGDTWILRQAQRLYAPMLDGVMRRRGWAMGISLVALAGALVIFTRLGAEFVPQLDEGDVLVEARRLPGVSLTKSIEILGRAERALLAIPEIDHVVSKTGSPDLATDAMSISETDMYISLKPEAAWRSGLTKSALTKQISATLAEKVPEVAAGISQPIQMRTNELVVGVKSDDGKIDCWGALGIDDAPSVPGKPRPPKPTPKPKLVAGLKGVASVALGGDHSCALLQDGSATCWGDNEKGQLGDGSPAKKHAPAKVKGLVGVVELALGRDHTCARLADASVQCWGGNAAGQLGDGTTTDRKVPAAVPGIAGAAAILAAGDRTCARLQSGSVLCWGDDADGAIGGAKPSPTAVTW